MVLSADERKERFFGRSNAPRLAMTKKNMGIEDGRVSVCTDCRWGIFVNHTYHWTRRGLVHVDCKRKVIIDEIKGDAT